MTQSRPRVEKGGAIRGALGTMNLTIWSEVVAAALVLVAMALMLWQKRASTASQVVTKRP